MKTLKSEFTFYDLPEVDRKAMVGTRFITEGRETIYFPIDLMDGEEDGNYGKPQGLIFVTEIMTYKGNKWFRVGVSSPDDLDIDLDFGPEDTQKRQEIITYLEEMRKVDVTYKGVLLKIQKRFGGTFTSG